MKLSEFIAESLKEIFEGTIAAQQHATTVGAKINHPDLIVKANNQMRRLLTNDQIAQDVEFTVAICVPEHENSPPGDNGTPILVRSIGKADGIRRHWTDVASCLLRFTIPIALPLQKK